MTNLGKPIDTIVIYNDMISLNKYDPVIPENIEVIIPGDLVLETAGGLGKYQIRNIYKLSENEKKGDELFKKTFMKNFGIPIHRIINCSFRNYDKGNSFKKLLGCSGKNKLASMVLLTYSRWSSGENVSSKNLSDYKVLIAKNSPEGKYILSDDVFSKMEFDFSQDMEIDKVVNVEVVIAPDFVVPQYINDSIKIMGGRVVGVVVGSYPFKGLMECLVIGGDLSFIKNVSEVFGCDTDYRKEVKDAKLIFSPNYLRLF